MNKALIHKIIWLLLFYITMAFLESAVVIYLRELYYPKGFSFPLSPIDSLIGITEILREAATLIMLISIAVLVGKSRVERFAYFIFGFGVWDIFYYVFLKLLVNWPESLLTWDVLFLIPLTWTGPVLAPIINSLTMIVIAILIILIKTKYQKIILFNNILLLLIVGSLFCIYVYIADYATYLFNNYSLKEVLNALSNEGLLQYAQKYIPVYFNWWVFLMGVLIHFIAIYLLIIKNMKIFKFGLQLNM